MTSRRSRALRASDFRTNAVINTREATNRYRRRRQYPAERPVERSAIPETYRYISISS
jgi:hypothetical protein